MMLAELTQIQTSELPLEALRAHLRLGTGFSDVALQDPILESSLRAAVAAIEARTGKVILSRGFRWTVSAWRCPEAQALPMAPVVALMDFALYSSAQEQFPISADQLVLIEDTQRPQLKSRIGELPRIPIGGRAEITFLAGFGTTWDDIPADLAHAVMLLAAHYYEIRHEHPMNDGNMPFGVTSLIEKYRTVRILGGAVA